MSALTRGRYEQLEVVGWGGEGRVVKALDHLHDRTVALKVRAVRSEADREALLSEAGILFRLPASPHLPIVREDFFDGDDYVIVMDWVDGADLSRMLHTDGRPGLAPTLVLQWLADAAAALTHLHNQDPPVIHGDIKPANLILTKGGRVSLVDFGASSTVTGPGRRGGTPGYAAPERATQGESTRASDIYSLAATAFALLTGAPPTGVRPAWDGIEPTLAAQLEAAIREGLATDPARRPATPGELVERLRAGWAGTLPTGVLTFCFTDIVGSTGLWESDPTAMSKALVLHDTTIATAVERHGGRLIDAMGEGDSTVSVFDSPTRAVDAAIDLTRALAAVSWPPGLAIRARVALHTGEADFRDGSYYGTTLNIAARVRGLADGGQVFVSDDTAALVRKHLPDGVALVDLGPARLRGRTGRTQVYAIAAAGLDAPPPGTECPYPGLLSFGAGDADRYFGRDAVVADLLARLAAHPFVTVIGASGSGKSSLLQAGVASRWPTGADVITPGSTPALDGSWREPSDRLLIVDQFEELFTLVDSADKRDAFVEALLQLQRPVAIGLRADFYGACAAYRDLAQAVASHQVLLGPMTGDELRAAIEEPAGRAGLRLEPGLVELLVSEVEGEPGELPLLAHALRATWEERDGRTLTLEAYRATGGVKGAIGATADEVLDSFDDADRGVAKQLLLRLVELGEGINDTRRRATLTELRPAGDSSGRADRIVDTLATARLVSIDAGTVQVAHEALIREWPQLRMWLAEERDDLRVQRQVTIAAEAWSQSGREPTELFRGPRLATALEWLERDPHASELETEFVRESATEEERVQHAQARANRRLRASLIGVGIALVLAVLGGVYAVRQSQQAADSRDHADVARVAAVSRSLSERQPDVGLLLGAEANRREDSADTRGALIAALEANPLLEGLIYGAESGFGAAVFTPDGKTLATPASDGSGTVLWSTASHRRVGALRNGGAVVIDADISPDGRTLVAATVTFSDDNVVSHLQVWDLASRKLTHNVESPGGFLSSAAYSADGRTVITQGGTYIDRLPEMTEVVWDAATWRARGAPWVLSQTYLDDQVTVVSRDGAVLAIPDGDGATVFDVATRETRRHVPVTDGEVTTLALSSDGASLAIALDTGVVVGVDTVTGERKLEAFTGGDVSPTAMEFSRDDTVLAVGNISGRTQLLDVASGAALGPPLAASSSAIFDVSFSVDGSRLATVGGDRTGAIWRLDGSRAAARSWTDHKAVATQIDITPDGRFVVSGGADGSVVARDVRSGTTRSGRRAGEVHSVDLDRQGRQVVSGDTNGDVVVAGLADLKPRRTKHFAGAWIYAAVFNPRTGVVAIAVDASPTEEFSDNEGCIAFWDPATGRETAPRIVEQGGDPIALAWSPDGHTLVASTENNVVRFYRAGASYRQIGDDLVSEDDTVTAVAFSPDGRMIAAGTSSSIVRRYDVATHDQIGPDLRGHTFEIRGVAFSPDGSLLASTSVGLSTTRLWDAASGTPVGGELVAGRTPYTERTIPIERPYPSQPVFDPGGQTLYTPGVDGSVMAWDLRPSSWARAACRIAGRNLTRAEWRQYVGAAGYRATCPSE
jgi:WD40 repeat protein/class 3 adenylate cyclase